MTRNSTAKGTTHNGRSKLSHMLSYKVFNHEIDLNIANSSNNNISGLPDIRKPHSQERSHYRIPRDNCRTLDHTRIVKDLAEGLSHLYIFKKSKDKDESPPNKIQPPEDTPKLYELSTNANDFSIREPSVLASQKLFKLVLKQNDKTPTATSTFFKPDYDSPLNTTSTHHAHYAPPSSSSSSSLLQKLYMKNLGNVVLKDSKTPTGSPFNRSPAGSASPNKRTKRKDSISQILNYQLPLNNPTLAFMSLEDTDQGQHLEYNKSQTLPVMGLPKRHGTMPIVAANSEPVTPQPEEETRKPRAYVKQYKRVSEDPFSKLVKYKDSKIPFSLAVNAEARQKMFNEVKKAVYEKVNMDSVLDLRDKKIPEAKAKFLKTITTMEKKKKESEMRSRSSEKNTLYQIYALDKDSQKRVKKRLRKQLSENSRFVNV